MSIAGYLYSACAFIGSALFTALIMPWLLNFCQKRGLYDMPNERKVHSNKIPRLGGVVFIPAMLIGISIALGLMIYFSEESMFAIKISTLIILSGIFLIYCIGLLDDLFGLKAKLKFLIQFVATLFMPLCGLYLNNLYGFLGIYEIPIYVGYPLTVFVALLIVNSVNLIDGIDGLAAGLGLITLTIFFGLFCALQVISYALFTAGLLGTLLVFFYYNMYGKVENNTKTFMGDTGSLILGYAIAFLTIKYAMNNEHVLPYRPSALLISYTAVIVPTFDLIRVALMRIKRGESIFHADKTHFHHKFMAAGFSMHKTLILILLLQVALWILNLLLYSLGLDITYIVILNVLLYTIIDQLLNMRIKASATR